jgi:hypothetical protein
MIFSHNKPHYLIKKINKVIRLDWRRFIATEVLLFGKIRLKMRLFARYFYRLRNSTDILRNLYLLAIFPVLNLHQTVIHLNNDQPAQPPDGRITYQFKNKNRFSVHTDSFSVRTNHFSVCTDYLSVRTDCLYYADSPRLNSYNNWN